MFELPPTGREDAVQPVSYLALRAVFLIGLGIFFQADAGAGVAAKGCVAAVHLPSAHLSKAQRPRRVQYAYDSKRSKVRANGPQETPSYEEPPTYMTVLA